MPRPHAARPLSEPPPKRRAGPWWAARTDPYSTNPRCGTGASSEASASNVLLAVRKRRWTTPDEWQASAESTLTYADAFTNDGANDLLWYQRPLLFLEHKVPLEENEETLLALHLRHRWTPPLPQRMHLWNEIFPLAETIREYVSTLRQQCNASIFPWPTDKMALQKSFEVAVTLLPPGHMLILRNQLNDPPENEYPHRIYHGTSPAVVLRILAE